MKKCLSFFMSLVLSTLLSLTSFADSSSISSNYCVVNDDIVCIDMGDGQKILYFCANQSEKYTIPADVSLSSPMESVHDVTIDGVLYSPNNNPNVELEYRGDRLNISFCSTHFNSFIIPEGTKEFVTEACTYDEVVFPSSIKSAFFWMSSLPDRVVLPGLNERFDVFQNDDCLLVTDMDTTNEAFLNIIQDNPRKYDDVTFVLYTGAFASKFALNNPIKYVVKNMCLGDVDINGEIDLKDVLAIRKYMAHIEVSLYQKSADYNGDKQINMKDVLAVRKYLVSE